MKAAEWACEVSARVGMSFSIGQPVRVRHGMLAGFSGTLAGLPSSGRAKIRLHEDIYLEIDQSCLELESAE